MSNYSKFLSNTLLLFIIWTIIILALLYRDLNILDRTTENLAKREALAHFQKDEAFRFWSAVHGGFYVVANERTPPNPYLDHVPARDIITPSGVKLTLMNPAYALRQMFEEYEAAYGVSGHITSLKPLRPENSPDEWERAALESFENGETEIFELISLHNEPHLRFMKPLITQEGCLKCHEHQGYKVGDIRGGVSVSVPLTAYYLKEEKASTNHIISFASLWFIGIIGIFISSRVTKRNRREKDIADKLLQESHDQLENRVIERTNELQGEIEKHKIAEIKLRDSEELYKGIIQSTASAIAVYKPTEDNKDFIIIDFNPTAEKLDKITKEEIVGKKVTEVFPGIEEFGLLKVMQEVANSGMPQHFPLSFYIDSRHQGFRENYVYKLSTGEIVAVYQDVTDREMVKKELQLERDKLISIFESMVDGIYIVSEDYDLDFVNSILKKDFGPTDGKKCYEYFYQVDKPCAFCKNKEVFGGSTIHWENKFQANNKTYHIIDTPLVNADGTISKLVIFRDITDHKKSEKEILRLSTAVEQSPSIITITNLKGDIEYVNPKFTELTGYTLEEVKGKNPRILKSGLQSPEIYRDLWNVITSGKTWSGELHNKKKNNKLIWESVMISPIFDKKGKITNYLKVAEDVTVQKRNDKIQLVLFNIAKAVATTNTLEELIKQIQAILGTIIDTTNFYVALYNADNDTLELPYYADEKDSFKSIPAAKTLTKYVIDTKKPLLADIKLKKKLVKEGKLEFKGSLSKIWLGVPFRVENKIIGVFAVQSYKDENAFNLSGMKMLEFVSDQIGLSIDRKRAEDNLSSALIKANESDRLKTAFLQNISHEIRTPMNGIFGFSSLLKNTNLSSKEQQSYIDVIMTSGKRMLNTLNDLMDISKLETEQVKLNFSNTNVNSELRNIHTFFTPEIENKGLKFTLTTPLPDSEVNISTDKEKFYAILSNLVKNALKYTHKGSIELGYRIIKDYLEFFIVDTGIGIPNKRQEAIFERFIQADIEDIKVYEGAGLGLSISKGYVNMLKGRIWVESDEGVGSQFYFTLPYKPEKKYKTKNTKNKKNVKLPNPELNLQIIIAEDEEVAFDFLKIILDDITSSILHARNGKEAIELYRNNPTIDLILMDIKMPVMSGYEATKKIREFDKEVLIIAQTAYALVGDKQKALDAGCNDYISKPIKKEELIRKIKKLIMA